MNWDRIAVWVGHANGRFSEARYGQVLAEDREDAIALADRSDAVEWTMARLNRSKNTAKSS